MSPNIYKALPYYLIHNSGLSALISDRIYWNEIPQGSTIPALYFEDIDTVAIKAHKEKSALPKKRIQFSIVSVSLDVSSQIAAALKNAIDGYKGNMGTGAYITDIQCCLFENERSSKEPETALKVIQQDYFIMYKE